MRDQNGSTRDLAQPSGGGEGTAALTTVPGGTPMATPRPRIAVGLRPSPGGQRRSRERVRSATPSRLQRDVGRGTAGQDSRRYLLFAGTQQPPNGGLCDLVDSFTSEQAARQAFCEIRLRTASSASWAQLAVVDGDAGITPLCWFGIGAEPRRGVPTIDRAPIHLKVLAADRTQIPNRIKVLVAALVAVATTMIAVLVDSDERPSPARPHPAGSVPSP